MTERRTTQQPRGRASQTRFGPFELDARTGELRKHGVKIRLAAQPLEILVALLEAPGDLVSRATLKERLWPGDANGDFEQGINRAVGKLREALGDSAATPKYVETLPGRGYRFVGELEAEASPDAPPRRRRLVLALCVCLAAAAVAMAARFVVPPEVPSLRWRKLTNDNYGKTAPALSDNSRVYFAASFAGEQFIAQVPVSGGQSVRVPIVPPGPAFSLHDLSPDGRELLLTAAASRGRDHAMPLWTLRIADGSARRLGSIVATSAAYSPAGDAIAYSTPTELWAAEADGTQARRLLEAADSVLSAVTWSPDGRRIRFSREDPLTRHSIPWEIGSDGGRPRELLAPADVSLAPAGWTPDGALSIFSGGGDFWGTPESWSPLAKGEPVQLIRDAPEFGGLIRIRTEKQFHAVGTDRLGELQSFDRESKEWTPLLDGISAEAVEYSPDGERVAYITYPQQALWVRQADGSRPIQLTSLPLRVAFPRWSPDGSRLVFSGAAGADEPMRLYTVSADGGQVRPVLPPQSGSQGYPTWSPDGLSVLYGIFIASTREEVYIRVVDLKSGTVSKLPGSDGLFAPRYSPDGKFVAALQWSGARHLMLLEVETGQWNEVPGPKVDWPAWMPDSQSVLGLVEGALKEYRVAAGSFEHIEDLKVDELGGRARWIGIGPDGAPLRTLNRDSRQVYQLELAAE